MLSIEYKTLRGVQVLAGTGAEVQALTKDGEVKFFAMLPVGRQDLSQFQPALHLKGVRRVVVTSSIELTGEGRTVPRRRLDATTKSGAVTEFTMPFEKEMDERLRRATDAAVKRALRKAERGATERGERAQQRAEERLTERLERLQERIDQLEGQLQHEGQSDEHKTEIQEKLDALKAKKEALKNEGTTSSTAGESA